MAVSVTPQNRADVSNLYVALFGRAPDGEGLGYWSRELANGATLTKVANDMFSVPAARAYYPSFATNKEIIESFYLNVLGRVADPDGSAFYTAKLNAVGATPGSVITGLISDIINYTPSGLPGNAALDAAGTKSKALFLNKADVALSYGLSNGSVAGAQIALNGVNETAASVAAAKAGLNVGQVISLTTGLDNVVGTAGIDTFNANVVQNAAGSQTNQLATGDKIIGGGGVDVLNAVVQVASPLGAGPTSAIAPITTGVEQTLYTALTTNNGPIAGQGRAETVYINAKSQTGLTKVGSVQSDASLFISNLTTLKDDGIYATRGNTSDITVRMDHSGNNNAPDAQSNLTVLFDNDYLVSGKTSVSTIVYFVEDREAAALNPLTPLKKIDATGIVFTLNGVRKDILLSPATLVAFKATDASFQGFANLLQAQLNILKLTDPSLANLNITLDTNNLRLLGKDGTTLPVPAPAITVTSSVGETLIAGGFTSTAEFGVTYDVFTEIANGINVLTIAPITSNIELLKAGRGAEGGALVVGAMNTDLANVFDYSKVALKEGVEVFNIVVSGDTTQMSSLSRLSSTNNTLERVNVTYATGSVADLNIGNSNTAPIGAIGQVNGANLTVNGIANFSSSQNLGLKDVRTFTVANNTSDASNPLSVQTNDVTLNAYLSDEVVAKYMNRVDNIANAATDNANFVYTTGSGNDVLNLNISKSNLAASGTAAREDFSLVINAGDGNNRVTTQIGNGEGVATDAWYINQTIQKNLSITTGAGSDVIRVNGAGSFNINSGGGNDAIYSDSSGRQVITTVPAVGFTPAVTVESNAVWVFNTVNQSQTSTTVATTQFLNNLQSAPAVADATKVANLELTLSYRGINSTVKVGDTASAAGGTVNDLTINQAIKAAINDNVYLKNLLIAQDGTGRTLVVTSLTDGVFNDGDITITVANPTALTPAQSSNGAMFATPAQLTALGLTGGTFVAGGRFDSAIAEDSTAFVFESAIVGFTAFTGAGSQTVGGLTISSTVAATDAQVASVASGGTFPGVTITTPSTRFVVTQTAAQAGTAATTFTSPTFGDQLDANSPAPTFTGASSAPVVSAIVQGSGAPASIVGANSGQANANVIEAGLGLDTVILSTAGVTLAKETVNVANLVADADVVFNAGAGATITVDSLDTVITSSGILVTGGVGTVSVLSGGITGTAGNDNINASNASSGQNIDGGAGNDVIIGSAFNDIITGGLGGDKMNGLAGNDTFVIGNLDSGLVIASADEITGFVSGADRLSMGFAGDATVGTGNYVESVLAVSGFAAALAAANSALNTLAGTSGATELFAFEFDATNGYLFNDIDGNGTADQVVILVGTIATTFAASDIIV